MDSVADLDAVGGSEFDHEAFLDGAGSWNVGDQRTFQAGDWAHIAVSGTIWVLLPLALGLLRLLHREVKSA